MIFKLHQSEKNYLMDKILKNKIDILATTRITNIGHRKVEFCVEKEAVDKIRDLCSEKLQIIGFDENYKLTEDGQMLEKLIDIFYVG